MKSYDLTIIYWEPLTIIPNQTFGYPKREKLLPLLRHYFGLKVQLLNTRNYFRNGNFRELIKDIKANKILVTFSEEMAKKNYHLLGTLKEKELYFIIQAEENKEVRKAMPFLLKIAKKVFVTQERYKKEFGRQKEFREKIKILRFPTEMGRQIEKEESRKILGIRTPNVIIHFGYIRRVKNTLEVIKLAKELEDVTVLVVESVENTCAHRRYLEELKRFVKQNNLETKVIFSGGYLSEEDLDVWFSAADLMVYPHKKFAEASLAFAIGHGKACITSEHEGFEEWSREAGIVTTSQLKETVEFLLKNKREIERLERKSREYAKRHNFFKFTTKLIQELELEIKEVPKIAVWIPVKNAEDHILRHLENWKNIHYPKTRLKLYFIDGHSKDRTVEIIEEFCRKNHLDFEIHEDPEYENPINASGWIAETMNSFKNYSKDEDYVVVADSDIVYFNPYTLLYLLQWDVDIIAPYVYTEPSSKQNYDCLTPCTRYFYDCTLFRTKGLNFGKKAPFRDEKDRIVLMESVGCFVLVKREVLEFCKFDNPLPTYQLLKQARRKGFQIFAYPYAKVFHKVLKEGHKSIFQHVKEGRLPRTVLEKIPVIVGFISESNEKKYRNLLKVGSVKRIDAWRELGTVVKSRCPACFSKNIILEEGKVWCKGCGNLLGKDPEKYFQKMNVLLIIADALRYDYFLKSKIPEIWKGVFFKCYTDQIHTGRAVPVLLTGRRRENILLRETRTSKRNPETTFLEQTEIRTITAWDIFEIKGYYLGYINLDWEHQTREQLLKANQISLFESFPAIKNLEELLKREPFFGVLHFWSTHSPYGFGKFPRNCEKIYKKCYELLKEGNVEELHKIYKHGVEGFERQMKVLREILEERDLLQRTLVVITADHGEALGESGRFGHAAAIWEDGKRLEELRRKEIQEIPLLFYHPSFSPVFLGTCKQEDILPTILKLVQIKVDIKFDGRELL